MHCGERWPALVRSSAGWRARRSWWIIPQPEPQLPGRLAFPRQAQAGRQYPDFPPVPPSRNRRRVPRLRFPAPAPLPGQFSWPMFHLRPARRPACSRALEWLPGIIGLTRRGSPIVYACNAMKIRPPRPVRQGGARLRHPGRRPGAGHGRRALPARCGPQTGRRRTASAGIARPSSAWNNCGMCPSGGIPRRCFRSGGGGRRRAQRRVYFPCRSRFPRGAPRGRDVRQGACRQHAAAGAGGLEKSRLQRFIHVSTVGCSAISRIRRRTKPRP